jgi:ferredoxin
MARRYFETDDIAGFVLPCTAKPRSDVVIEAGKTQEMLQLRADNDQPPGRSKLG